MTKKEQELQDKIISIHNENLSLKAFIDQQIEDMKQLSEGYKLMEKQLDRYKMILSGGQNAT